MTMFLILIISVFCLKLTINFITPFYLAWLEVWRKKKTKISFGGIVIEIGLWLIAIPVAAMADGSTWIHSSRNIAIWGMILIFCSYSGYVLFAIIGCLVRFAKGNK